MNEMKWNGISDTLYSETECTKACWSNLMTLAENERSKVWNVSGIIPPQAEGIVDARGIPHAKRCGIDDTLF